MVRFCHPEVTLYRKSRSGGPSTRETRCTIAYEVEDDCIKFAVVYCSPNDSFVKRYGREEALKRLTEAPSVVQIPGIGTRGARVTLNLTKGFAELERGPGYPKQAYAVTIW